MASLENRNGSYRVVFRFGKQKFSRSLRTRSERSAQASVARLEDNLRRVELGTLSIPEDADVASFLLSDGKANGKPKAVRRLTLKDLFSEYERSLPGDAIEESTLYTARIHMKHLLNILGRSLKVKQLTVSDLQGYVEQRSKQKGLRGKSVSPTTIKLELRTFSTVWTWAWEMGHVEGPFPKKGLRFPKVDEKPPFQTRAEIERKIARGGLSPADEAELWDCLFLTLPEIDEFLAYTSIHARQPFIYPMLAFAAHTGARRSELLRSEIDDVDLYAKEAVIREKKRIRGKRSLRRVPLSPFLVDVLKQWFGNHPGGRFTFCQDLHVAGSRKRRTEFCAVTRDEAHDHFQTTVSGSKWEKLRGWHVLRHSFCSNCAAKGIDQRIINAWVGHQTEEMVRRYRHLIPNQQQEAISAVFGTHEPNCDTNAP